MMKAKNLGIFVILGIVLIFFFWGCSGYNGLVKQDETVKNAFNNVQTEYQKRSDLVPNLVNTVKGAANFEQETITKVIEARAKATQVQIKADDLTPEKLAQFQQAQGELGGAIGRLLVSVEKYPELRATQGFLDLQKQLEGIENGIKESRRVFNGTINDYNVKVRSFPMNMLSGMFGFKAKEGFKADEGAEKAPKVDFEKK
jgi:LemA protein